MAADLTPVYDAIRREAGSDTDTLLGGAFSRFQAKIENPDVQFVTVHDDCDMDHPHYGYFPDRDEPLPAGRMWVECQSRLVDGLLFDPEGYDKGVQTGVLIETMEPDDATGWPYCLTTARFAFSHKGAPFIPPGMVIADTATYAGGRLSFADFERNRHGLLMAKDATEDQLHQMNHYLVELDGRYIRAIPTNTVPATYRNMPPYRQASDAGTEGLRAALSTTCVKPWFPVDMADVDPAAAEFFRLFDNVLTRGPFVALALLALIGSPSPAYRTVTLPAVPGRDREISLICPPWADPTNRN